MNTMFMNSQNSKTTYHHRLLLNLTDKIDFRRSNKYVVLSNLCHALVLERIHTL